MKPKTLINGVILTAFVLSMLLGACGPAQTEVIEEAPTATSPEPTAEPTAVPTPVPTPTPTLGEWTAATSLPEHAAGGVVRCEDDPDSFYLLTAFSDFPNSFYRYDISTASWQQLANLPMALFFSCSTCYQGKIYVAGGSDWVRLYQVLYIYDIQKDKWTYGKASPESTRGAALGAWEGKLYLVGGFRDVDTPGPVSTVDVYDIATNTWTAGGGAAMPTASGQFARVQVGPYLYVVGGFSNDLENNVNQTQRYDMSTNTWEVGPTFTSARANGTLVASSSHLFMLGGDLNGGGQLDLTDLVEVLDLSAWPEGEWTDLGRPLPAPNISPATTCTEVLTKGEIWNVGGLTMTDEGPNVYDAVYYLPIGEGCP